MRARDLALGIDVGSTTGKAVVVDGATRAIVWSRYGRHESRLAEHALALVEEVCARFGTDFRVFATGSGVTAIAPLLHAKVVHEVHAVTRAVEHLHPDVRTVVELGGQDSKLIRFRTDPATGVTHATHAMNDRCASGTGATIDRCVRKLGLSIDDVRGMHARESAAHPVAAQCGVFAATDLVNLLKSGVPPPQIVGALGDAIVEQNLAMLAGGETLHPRVLLLGGPHAHFPWLRECWQRRLPALWRERGIAWPVEFPPESLVFAPEDAALYGALGAALHGLAEPAEVGRFPGLDALERRVRGRRDADLAARSGPPLVRDAAELDAFRREFAPPPVPLPSACPRARVEAVVGLDGGSTSTKAVLLDADGRWLGAAYRLSAGNPLDDARGLLAELRDRVREDGGELAVLALGVTGYAADLLAHVLRADVNVVETVAHAASATHHFPHADVVCDVGGQDIKLLLLERGEIRDFRLSNQCSAGHGSLLQALAEQVGVPLAEYAATAFSAERTPRFGTGCAVFLDAARVGFQRDGYTPAELLAGLAHVLPMNVWQHVARIPRLARLGREFVLQGGTQRNEAALKAQVDYIRARVPGAAVRLHPHPGEAGAHGAALEALAHVARGEGSSFIGIDAALALRVTVRSDETTRCGLCARDCMRTFVDARTADGTAGVHIAGCGCEKGSADSKEALKAIVRRRNAVAAACPDLLEVEGRLRFEGVSTPRALPAAGTLVDDVEVGRSRFPPWMRRRRPVRRPFARSGAANAARRASLRIAIPRVLAMYELAPWFRGYFETLGIARDRLVFSDATDERLRRAGEACGGVGACFPARVAVAHVHDLLERAHGRTPFPYLFFPCVTHVPGVVAPVVDSTSCPVAAGAPKVVRAALTREKDRFAEKGVELVDPVLTFAEREYLRKQMHEAFGARLGVTRDESDFACDEGWRALDAVDRELQRRGREVLDDLERRDDMGVVCLAHPYHADPGVHHGVLREIRDAGFAVLTPSTLPRDPATLARLAAVGGPGGAATDPLDVRDVWRENYAAHGARKVWAAKFAARSPRLAVIELASFKCGPDATTAGVVDDVLRAGGSLFVRLQDLDATRPAGSFGIRSRTLLHALRRRRDALRGTVRSRDAAVAPAARAATP